MEAQSLVLTVIPVANPGPRGQNSPECFGTLSTSSVNSWHLARERAVSLCPGIFILLTRSVIALYINTVLEQMRHRAVHLIVKSTDSNR